MKYLKLIIIFFLSIFLISCDSNKVFEENIRITDSGWNREYQAEFTVEIEHPESLHNLYINVRNSGKYLYSNLYLFVNTLAPGGAELKDTLDCKLAEDNGKWTGSGVGGVWFNQIPYKRNIRFPQKGRYKFIIEQAMRVEVLKSISDIGIRVELADNE